MLKINIVCVGKIKEEFYRAAVAEYAKRLSRFCKLEIKEIAEDRDIEREAEPILRAAKGKIVALCVEGERLSSEDFARDIKRSLDKGEEITFIIGSSCGLSDRVKSAANARVSFSDMTFPHQLMRVILTEQIYRAFMLISGSEYHK